MNKTGSDAKSEAKREPSNAERTSGQHGSDFIVDLVFPHQWQAEILTARPAILPARHFIYPRDAEEVERGALEVLVRPNRAPGQDSAARGRLLPEEQEVSGHDCSRADTAPVESTGALAPAIHPAPVVPSLSPPPFLATCALGFRDPVVPTGVWSCPNPNQLLAVAGGYGYVIDTTAPERFTMIPYRPVLEVRLLPEEGLLLFVGHHSILAWGREGQAWQSEKLSDEGVTIAVIDAGILRGTGWTMMTDRETPFALSLSSGLSIDAAS